MNEIEMEDLVRKMERLIVMAERCRDAREALGGSLEDARAIVDRMQWLCDRAYIRNWSADNGHQRV